MINTFYEITDSSSELLCLDLVFLEEPALEQVGGGTIRSVAVDVVAL